MSRKQTALFFALRLALAGVLAQEDTGPSPSSYRVAEGHGILVWAEVPTWKVFRDTAPPPTDRTAEAVTLRAAAHEYEPFQLVLTPQRPLAGVTLTRTDLAGPIRIARSNLSYRPVGFVDQPSAVSRQPSAVSHLPSAIHHPPSAIPDPLLPVRWFDVPAKANQPVWITVSVPPGTPPGEYVGTITVWERQAQRARIPLKLRVEPFELPSGPPLRVSAEVAWSAVRETAGGRWDEVRRNVLRNLAAHRMGGPGPLPVEPQIENTADGLSLRTAEFDQWAALSLDELGFTAFSFPLAGLEETVTSKLLAPETRPLFARYVQQMAEHLRGRDWLRHAVLWLGEEAEPGSESQRAELAQFLRETAPDLRVGWPGPIQPALADLIRLWCPTPEAWDHPTYRTRRVAGDEIWLQDEALWSLDAPALHARIFPWLLWRYSFDGARLPGVTDWPPTGRALLYPPPEGRPEPINSLRWELLREGLEDVIYLRLLMQLAEHGEPKAQETARAVLREAAGLIQGLHGFEPDVTRWQTVRERAADVLGVWVAATPPI